MEKFLGKAQKRKIRGVLNNLLKYIILIILISCSAIFLLYNNKIKESVQLWTNNKINEISFMSGFVVKDLYIQGSESFEIDEEAVTKIVKSAKIKINQSIFKHSPNEIKENIEKLPWVKNVVVDRNLPNSIYITVSERRPIAIKQYKKKLSLVDEDGNEYNTDDYSPYLHYPIIVSQDAETHAKFLVQSLSSNKNLFSLISSIVYVSGRRWDVILKNNTVIKLPEQGMEKRWLALSNMVSNKEINLAEYKSIDLRVPKRMFLEKIKTQEKD
jgi:cell division protein FtsQ